MERHRCMGCMSMTENEICEKCGWQDGRTNEAHQLPVGYMLHGQYRIGRVLGQGGFGITYLGWDDFLEIPVAIKEFYPNSMVNREAALTTKVHCYTENAEPQFAVSKERFLREAQALARFEKEPAIVKIRGFFEENETAYIVMEYIRGVTLAGYVRVRGGRLTPEETFRILRPVMEALVAVHKVDMVHRDISPDNIMLHPEGGAKLLDFGAVRAVEGAEAGKDLDRSTEAILKHGFAPIEQYRSRGDLGPWTDEYALCATIWYCLTGRIPEDAPARMMEDIEIDWDIPGLDERQKAALKKGFSPRSRDRFGSVEALMKRLFHGEYETEPDAQEEFTSSKPDPITDKADVSAEADKKKKRPRKGLILVSAALVVILAVVLVWFLFPTGWKTSDAGRFYYVSGHLLTDSWLEENGKWYHFAADGSVDVGVVEIDGGVYYFGEDGARSSGWVTVGMDTCYFGEDGVRVVGWRTIDGSRYYFDERGIMATGLVEIDGAFYGFGQDGIMLKGWNIIGPDRYHFSEDGTMFVGWLSDGNDRYYLTSNGPVATGWQEIDGARYYFDENGIMRTGRIEVDGKVYFLKQEGSLHTGWKSLSGKWYYFGPDGVMRTDWIYLDGKCYYLGTTGERVTNWQSINGNVYYFGDEGVMHTGWLMLLGHKHYFDANGIMFTGLRRIGNYQYYFDENGYMQTGYLTVDGKNHYFDDQGRMRW